MPVHANDVERGQSPAALLEMRAELARQAELAEMWRARAQMFAELLTQERERVHSLETLLASTPHQRRDAINATA
jgi:muconolactone delta-isomerase